MVTAVLVIILHHKIEALWLWMGQLILGVVSNSLVIMVMAEFSLSVMTI